MAPLVYRLLRRLAQGILWVFYRRLEVRGAEKVPATGPLILAANHPNMFLDPLLLGATQPRVLSFLAKATLFRSRLLGRFLSACGVLPVYRRSDSPGESAKNELTFEACYYHLERGGAIALFPEGVSHQRQAVMPLKTGCARIALEAEARMGFRLGVSIVPVGLYLPERHLFRSSALVIYGSPLDPGELFAAYQAAPQEAVRELTTRLERRLQQLTLHVPGPEDEVLIGELREILAAPEPVTRVEIDQALVEAVSYFQQQDPARYARLRRQVLRYGRLLDALDLEHEHLGRRYRLGPVLSYLAPRVAIALAGFPLFLLGAVNNLLPYKIPAWTAKLLSRERVEVATIKLLAGMVTFPVFYALQTWLVARWAGAAAASLYLVGLPLSGLLALRYQEAGAAFLEEARVFSLHLLRRDRLARLRLRGGEIAAELERCREEFLEVRGQRPDGA
jgi:glycerol-3-phosphate O-acyltransferase/dihydroxyacetone phosphate acyltransferase